MNIVIRIKPMNIFLHLDDQDDEGNDLDELAPLFPLGRSRAQSGEGVLWTPAAATDDVAEGRAIRRTAGAARRAAMVAICPPSLPSSERAQGQEVPPALRRLRTGRLRRLWRRDAPPPLPRGRKGRGWQQGGGRRADFVPAAPPLRWTQEKRATRGAALPPPLEDRKRWPA
jgi:hypothetical protein